jgi:stearoyl-CoA desaturase (delta-9 desaturase)
MQYESTGDAAEQTPWHQHIPFWGVHIAAVIGAIWIGWSWHALAWLVGSYAVRMFAITAGYHRYFSHRTYKTSRPFQFVLALLGTTAVQQGPLWWAAHHRRHHKYSDLPEDVHSPRQRGFAWSHLNWIMAKRHKRTDLDRVRDLAKYPELRWLDKYHLVPVVSLAVVMFLIGGSTALVWGFFVATVACWHITFTINSLAHVWGRRRYVTTDDSRNNGFLALLTFGEGWHNNHHHYQRSARQGFYWWEIDVSFYTLKLFELLHVVWDVEGVPAHVRDEVAAPERERVSARSAAA